MHVILDVTKVAEWPSLFPCDDPKQRSAGNPVRIPLGTRSTVVHQGNAQQALGELRRLRLAFPNRKFVLMGEVLELPVR